MAATAYLAPGITDPFLSKLHDLRDVVLCIELPVRVHLVRLRVLLGWLLRVLRGEPEAELRHTDRAWAKDSRFGRWSRPAATLETYELI